MSKISAKIDVEMKHNPDGEWRFTRGYSSVLAAKAACRSAYSDGTVRRRDMSFRIYVDGKLQYVNALNGGWRLRWLQGNCLTREEQAA